MFIAHIRASDGTIQDVQTHLENVAVLARQYGEPTGFGAHAELAGLLHDMGKFTSAFTTYIEGAVYHHKSSTTKIDHSTAGAKYLYERYYDTKDVIQQYVVEMVGMSILSHHSGLQNFRQLDGQISDFFRRVVEKDLPYYPEVRRNFEAIDGNSTRVDALMEEAKLEFKQFLMRVQKTVATCQVPATYFLSYAQKLLFSCLIDADRTDTRRFEEEDTTALHTSNRVVFQEGYNRLITKLKAWAQDVTPLNQLRSEMSKHCDFLAERPSSLYTLSIPTGGGKTLASLRYACKHAVKYGKERIIYIVPYTTILEQNAAAVRQFMVNPDSVLEHHANVIDDSSFESEEDYYAVQGHKQMQLGRDNWQHPIIFTTMVQFLDAFFQKGTRKSRRLHNLTNSVLIFDEVQSVPYQHFPLFNSAVNFLHYIGNSSILLCTATQPIVGEMKYPICFPENSEMVPRLTETVKAFERVKIESLVEKQGWDAARLAQFVENRMSEDEDILIILNTKTAVRKLYEALREKGYPYLYHLSTSMCPAHRKATLDTIRKKLKMSSPVICVSTQLIEAGVDISFQTVIRSLAGLDSIAQAAGRCNRHHEYPKGHVFLIRSADEQLRMLPEIQIGGEVTADYILRDTRFKNKLLSPETIRTYFQYFEQQASRHILKKPGDLPYELIELIDGGVQNHHPPLTRVSAMFKTLEHYFQAIQTQTTAVIVPWQTEGKELIACFNETIHDTVRLNSLLKKAQQYSVNLFQHELQLLAQKDLIIPLYSQSMYVLAEAAYDEDFGVSIEGTGHQSFLLF